MFDQNDDFKDVKFINHKNVEKKDNKDNKDNKESSYVPRQASFLANFSVPAINQSVQKILIDDSYNKEINDEDNDEKISSIKVTELP